MLKNIISFFAALVCFAALSMLFTACSQESNGIVSKTYHNITAKYNGYFLAREKMKEIEAGLEKSRVENYNRILEIFPTVTPATSTSLSPALEEVIKKASIPVQRHKNSDWVDDSYLLIGKARFYKNDLENAVTTLKFVNSKGKDRNARHAALIALMRIYVQQEEYNNAATVDDFIKKQNLDKVNLRDYHLVKAYYHYRKKEYTEVGKNIAYVLPLFPKSDKKARLSFIVAQINQLDGQDEQAFKYYKTVLRNNPPYELSFYTKLNMAQVTALSRSEDVKKVRKYFKRLLKDAKNTEYKDKIYYEMGRFELKQDHLDKAIENFKTSVRVGGSNPNQKGYSYLKLAELNYDKLKKYEIAKNYYDSAVATLDTNVENYKQIVRRKNVLTDFVKEYTIVQHEDSLQKLARMDTTALYALIDKIIAEKEAQAKAAEKAAKRMGANAEGGGGNGSFFDNKSGLGFNTGGGGDGSSWYFYNLSAMSQGKATFTKKWGNRKLEDNWRRATKETVLEADTDPAQAPQNPLAPATGKSAPKDSIQAATGAKGIAGGNKTTDTPAISASTKRQSYLSEIPFSDEQRKKSDDKLQLALYNLGKIYEQKLDEPQNAIASFVRIDKNYTNFEKIDEVMYFLYLLYDKHNEPAKRDEVKKRLFALYPQSTYTKLIINPNYLQENKLANETVQKIYKEAFEYYGQNRFAEATQLLETIKSQYPDNNYRDKLALMEVLITGKTVDIESYKKGLEKFMEDFPKSNLVPYALNLRKTADIKKIAPDSSSVSAGDSTMVQYSTDLDKPHYFLAIMPQGKLVINDVKNKYLAYNKLYYTNDDLTTDDLILNPKYFVVRVKELKSKTQALYYLKKQKEEQSPIRGIQTSQAYLFVITPDNYTRFIKSKNIKAYLDFFTANYQKEINEIEAAEK